MEDAVNPEPPVQISTGFTPHTAFILGLDLNFSRLEATDLSSGGQAILISDINKDAHLAWAHFWTPKATSSLLFNISQVKMNVSRDRSLDNANLTCSTFGGNFSYILSPDLSLGSGLLVRQEMFIRALNSTDLTLDRVPISQFEIFSRYALFRAGTLSLGAQLNLGILLPTETDTYKIRSGTSYSGHIFIEHLLKKHPIQGGLYYSRRNYGSQLASQAYSQVGLDMSIRFDLFD